MRISRWKRVVAGVAALASAVTAGPVAIELAAAAVPAAPVIATGSGALSPMSTSDGRYLVLRLSDGSIVSIDFATGITTPLVAAGEVTSSEVALADAASARLVWITKDNVVRSRALTGGPVTELSTNAPTGSLAGRLVVAPDGRTVSWQSIVSANLPATSLWMARATGPAPASPVSATFDVGGNRAFSGDSLVFTDSFTDGVGTLRAASVADASVRTLSVGVASFFTTPLGNRVAYLVPTSPGAITRDVWTVRTDGTGNVLVATGVSFTVGLIFSPDGAHLMLSVFGGTVSVVPSSGGILRVIGGTPQMLYRPAFTGDSTHIILVGSEIQAGPVGLTIVATTSQVFAADGTNPFPATDATGQYFGQSASGEAVQLGGTSVRALDLSTGASRLVASPPAPSMAQGFTRFAADRRSLFDQIAASAPDTGDVLARIDLTSGSIEPIGPVAEFGVVLSVHEMVGGRIVYSNSTPCLGICPTEIRMSGPALPIPPPPPPTTPPSTTPTPPASSGTSLPPVFESVASPRRVLNTRDGTGTALTQIRPGDVLELAVAGHEGVSVDASAVALNVTAVDPVEAGYLTVWPCGMAAPTASNLNFAARQTVPNSVITKIGVGGKVCFSTSATTGLIADLAGSYGSSSAYRPLVPERLLETRRDAGQVGYSGDKPAPGQVIELRVTGVGHSLIPADADAAVLNITAVGATDDGYLTVWPCGSPQPGTSSLNIAKGATRANLVISHIGADGKVCIFSDRGTDVLADVAGFFPASSGLTSITPTRVLDTRPDTVIGYSGAKPAAGDTVAVKVTGTGLAPSVASSVVLNVTGTSATGNGFVTVWPCGTDRPDASNLNLERGVDAPNLVIAKVGANGEVCLFTERGAHLLVDLAGWI